MNGPSRPNKGGIVTVGKSIDVQQQAWDVLKRVIDPEVGLDIVNLGLVYGVEVWGGDRIVATMTMTTKACPMSEHIRSAAMGALYLAFPDHDVDVQVVWDPPWSPAMITPEGRAMLTP